jgi:hypothetical protein
MPDLTAKRTLVKSPPELWEELSEVERLAKHLGAFGEIKITKLEPEHTVAWEGEHASGTVSIEPSGWGTKVTLHAELPEGAEPVPPEPEPEPVPPEAEAEPETEPVPPEPEPEPEPAAEAAATEPEPAAEAVATDPHPTPVEPEPEPVAIEPDPQPEPPAANGKRRGFWGWLFRTRTDTPEPVAIEPEPDPPIAEPEPEPTTDQPESEPVATEPEDERAQPERTDGHAALTAAVKEPVDGGLGELCVVYAESSPRAPSSMPAVPRRDDSADPDESADSADPADAPLDPERARVILDEALDALGAAHHRPFSRG